MNDTTTETTETTKRPDPDERFAIVAYTGKGAGTRRHLLCDGWSNASEKEIRAMLWGASFVYFKKGQMPTVCAYRRFDDLDSPKYWTLFDAVNDDNSREIARHLSPDLSDAYFPYCGRTAGELAALAHVEPPALTYGLAV